MNDKSLGPKITNDHGIQHDEVVQGLSESWAYIIEEVNYFFFF